MDQVNRLKSRAERRLSPLNPMAGSSSPVAGSPLSSSVTRTRTPPVAVLSRPPSVASSPSKPQLESSLYLGSHPMLISAHSSPSKSGDPTRPHSFDPGSKMKELTKPLSYKRFVQYDTTDSESDLSAYEKELLEDAIPEHMSHYLFKTSLSCPEFRELHQLDDPDKMPVKKGHVRTKQSEYPSSPRSFTGKY